MKLKALPIPGAGVVTLALLTSLLWHAQPAPSTVTVKFVGSWLEDQSKRQIGALAQLRFRHGAAGQLEELRGPDERPLVQPVNFGTKPYPVDNSNNTIEWKQIDANHFERKIYESGKLLATRRIEISKDGKKMAEVTERSSADIDTVVYMRTSGDAQGLAGIWKADSIKSSEPAEQKIEAQGSSALRITTRRGQTEMLTFDGKPNLVTGPAVISGTMVAGKVTDANTIEVTGSRQGVVTGKSTWVLSTDGRTLTETTTRLAGGAPSVIVYQKQ
jgi:hypothetical protein